MAIIQFPHILVKIKMKKPTIKCCISKAESIGIKIYGDVKFRGDCPLEDSCLASFFAWVRYQYPQYANLIFHPETEMPVNGGSSFAYHAKSKAKGRVDNLPDVICLPISTGAPAFCCELKRRDISKSLQSKSRKEHFNKQLLILRSHFEHGAVVSVALGFDNLKKSFEEYVGKYGSGIETKEKNTLITD